MTKRITALSFCAILLTGCTSWFNMRNLKDDSLGGGFESVVLLRVKVADRTRTLAERYVQVDFLSRRDGNLTMDWIGRWPGEKENPWTQDEKTSSYDALFVARARPGKYRLVDCSVSAGNYAIHANLEDKALGFVVKTGEVVYLGELNVEVGSIVESGSSGSPTRAVEYTTRANLVEDRDTHAADLRRFRQSFPQISGRLRDAPSIAGRP